MDLTRWRSDTPGCASLVHLNNAGAALTPRPVRDAILGHLALEEELGGYEAADAQAEPIRQAYADVARLLASTVTRYLTADADELGLPDL